MDVFQGEDGELEEGEEKVRYGGLSTFSFIMAASQEEHVVQDFSRMSRKDKLAVSFFLQIAVSCFVKVSSKPISS